MFTYTVALTFELKSNVTTSRLEYNVAAENTELAIQKALGLFKKFKKSKDIDPEWLTAHLKSCECRKTGYLDA